MNRVIKYRVWNKSTSRMRVCGETSYEGINFHLGGEIYYYNLRNGDLSLDNSCILMQGINLSDKNDVEIYEGDIVEFYDKESKTNGINLVNDFYNRAVIVFKDGRFTLDKFLESNSVVRDNLNNHKETWWVVKNSVVMGNIYENSQLLR